MAWVGALGLRSAVEGGLGLVIVMGGVEFIGVDLDSIDGRLRGGDRLCNQGLDGC